MPVAQDPAQHHRVMQKARDLGLVEMTWQGGWGLTREGRELLDMIDELRSLDDRPGALPDSSPRRQAPPAGQSGTARAPGGTRQGDDRPTARGARGKTTKGGRRT